MRTCEDNTLTPVQHKHTHTHLHYTGGPAWRKAKALCLLSPVGGPDKSSNLTGKQSIMFGQTYLGKALTLFSLT